MFRRAGSFHLGNNVAFLRKDSVASQVEQRLAQQLFDVVFQCFAVTGRKEPPGLLSKASIVYLCWPLMCDLGGLFGVQLPMVVRDVGDSDINLWISL